MLSQHLIGEEGTKKTDQTIFYWERRAKASLRKLAGKQQQCYLRRKISSDGTVPQGGDISKFPLNAILEYHRRIAVGLDV